jgi:Tol biopolymer transport system component
MAARAMPPDEALPIARQIAEALEAAHERGITHRDLKPANIKLATDSAVKVLDFGLAKVTTGILADTDNSPTFTAATQTGAILGTAAYMSPEQARGLAVDKRTDIWAFGVVLFEMLTGQRLFHGDSTTDILAAVVREAPDFRALPATTPPSIRRLLTRCLEKDRRKRLPDIGVARLEIDDAMAPTTAPAEAPRPRASRAPLALVAVLIVTTLSAAAAAVWFASRAPAAIEWTGTRLGGPDIAMSPRVSPDGRLVAFLAMVDGLTQVAVLKPETGNWAVLTRDRSRGIALSVSWSPDSSKVYYDRTTDAPMGIFSVPVLGGEEKLVIESAINPEALPDGSFLVQRLNAERRYQLTRVWPETGRSQPLKFVLPWTTGGQPFRATPNGDRVAVVGTPLDEPASPFRLYSLDLATERVTRLADVPVSINGNALATTPDGQSVLTITMAGDLHRVVRVPLDGSPKVRTELTLTDRIEYVDVGRDGAIYLDQRQRPVEVIRVSADGRKSETITRVTLPSLGTIALPLPDGRVIANTRGAGREQLLITASGNDAVPFLEIQEPTRGPIALVSPTLVALVVGTDKAQTIALASLPNRRLVRRLEVTMGTTVNSVVASPDGRTLYYTSDGTVWSIPVEDGTPARMRKGDSITIDPIRQELIVRLTDIGGTRLVRQPLSGGPERPITIVDAIPLAPWFSWSSAVDKAGNILVPLAPVDSWFWPIGVLNPDTGRVRVLDAVGKDADVGAGFASDGSIILNAMRVHSTIWRFSPVLSAR